MAKSKKRKARRNVSRGIAHIQSTFNNTIVTITDTNGDAHRAAEVGRSLIVKSALSSLPVVMLNGRLELQFT